MFNFGPGYGYQPHNTYQTYQAYQAPGPQGFYQPPQPCWNYQPQQPYNFYPPQQPYQTYQTYPPFQGTLGYFDFRSITPKPGFYFAPCGDNPTGPVYFGQDPVTGATVPLCMYQGPTITNKNAQYLLDPGARVFVGNLSVDISPQALIGEVEGLFSQFGPCFASVTVHENTKGQKLPTAFVQFTNRWHAAQAVMQNNCLRLHGRLLRVEVAYRARMC